jgi:carbon monoxide dehydrogenase subunit G
MSDPVPGSVTVSMARYTASLETPRSPAETFAYLSDFATTEQWDPGVVEAERLGDAPIGAGTEFRVVARFLGRTNTLTYRIVEFEPDAAVTLRGENASVVSLDRITFEPAGRRTRITYDAELTLNGPLRLADPLLGLAFNRVGRRALEGLRATLADPEPVRHGSDDALRRAAGEHR